MWQKFFYKVAKCSILKTELSVFVLAISLAFSLGSIPVICQLSFWAVSKKSPVPHISGKSEKVQSVEEKSDQEVPKTCKEDKREVLVKDNVEEALGCESSSPLETPINICKNTDSKVSKVVFESTKSAKMFLDSTIGPEESPPNSLGSDDNKTVSVPCSKKKDNFQSTAKTQNPINNTVSGFYEQTKLTKKCLRLKNNTKRHFVSS